MTKFTTLAAIALTTTLLAIGQASAGFPGPGGEFAAPGGGGGGGGAWPAQSSHGEVDSPGDPFFPNGRPQRPEDRCYAAGGELSVQIEDGRTYTVCIL